MRDRLVLLVLLAALATLGGCGKEIGDACFNLLDCSPNGDRLCVDATDTTEGYCTIQGCDVDSCPEEAACVRFFSGGFTGRDCDPFLPDSPDAQDAPCSPDELCALSGQCVSRASEERFCMRKCESDGDCRDGYECRDLERMRMYGGQPLLAPGVQQTTSVQKFCARAP